MSDVIKNLSDQEVSSVSGGGANGVFWQDGAVIWYRIASGDTLSEIAVRFHTTIWNIKAMNPIITNVDLIREGWELRVL